MKFCTGCGEKLNEPLENCLKCGKELNTKKRKKELIKDIIALILYPVIMFVLGGILMFSWAGAEGISIDNYSTIEFMSMLPAWVVYVPLLVLLIIFSIMYRKNIVEDAKKITKKNMKVLFLMTGILLIANTLMSMLFSYLEVEVANQEAIEVIFHQSVIFSSFMIIIAASVVEEIFFRKALNTVIKNTPLFIALSGIIFGVLHWSGIATILYIMMGVIFSIAYIKMDKNLTAVILMHLINNAIGVIMLLVL